MELGWALHSETCGLMRRDTQRDGQCGEGGGDWSDASISQGRSRMERPPGSWREARDWSSLEPPGETSTANALVLDVRPPGLGADKFFLF